MVCLSHVGYGVQLTFRALALRRSRLRDCWKIIKKPLFIEMLFKGVLKHNCIKQQKM